MKRFIIYFYCILLILTFISCTKKEAAKPVEEKQQVMEQINTNVGLKEEDILSKQKLKEVTLVKNISVPAKIAYDPELIIAEKQFLLAMGVLEDAKNTLSDISIEKAEENLDKNYDKLGKLGLSRDTIKDIEDRKNIHTQLAMPEKKMWVYANFNKTYLSKIEDTAISVKVNKYAKKIYSAKIIELKTLIVTKDGKHRVILEIDNANLKLKPGMKAKVYFDLLYKDVKAIPAKIIIREKNKNYVWIEQDGEYSKREIKLGISGFIGKEKYIIITKGLDLGEKIVILK